MPESGLLCALCLEDGQEVPAVTIVLGASICRDCFEQQRRELEELGREHDQTEQMALEQLSEITHGIRDQ